MITIKEVGSTAKTNIIGLGLGAVAGYFIAKKAVKVENKWAMYGIIAVSAIAGAIVQKSVMANKNKATITASATK